MSLAQDLFLGFGEDLGVGVVSRGTRDLLNVKGVDVGDIADVAGRLFGALPAVIATGGIASLGARYLARRIATRAPGAARYRRSCCDRPANDRAG